MALRPAPARPGTGRSAPLSLLTACGTVDTFPRSMKLVPRVEQVSSFAEIEQDFIRQAHTVVWCSLATLDTKNRLRSRVLHPIWEGSTGWIATGRNSPKARHLARNPHVSLAYIANPLKPLYVDCVAEWDEDPAQKERIWNLFKNTPPPLGYDLAYFFGNAASPEYGLMKLTPWRIELGDLMGKSRVWRAG